MEHEYPGSSNLLFVEEIYADYERDPESVPAPWRRYFDALEPQLGRGENGATQIGPSFTPSSIFNPAGTSSASAKEGKGSNGIAYGARRATIASEAKERQEAVTQLVRNYRVRGHLLADLDPLGFAPVPVIPELEPEFYGFTEADMERVFACDKSLEPTGMLPLRELIARLKNTYCRTIGVQFTHIDDVEARRWLQQRMESSQNRIELGRKEQVRILTRLTDAVIFEEFIRRKFTGAKSFSLEGAESLVPLLDLSIEEAGEQGVQEVVIGMAHRGRLNVLANIIGKSPREIFREFEDKDPDLHMFGGDVKYHLGYVNDWQTSSGRRVKLSLCFNPSHLEFVNTVAMGRLRAKQDRIEDTLRERGLVILIHGDAAFAGEGVIQETLNLSQLPGYTVGGALHVIINNQIGFTTGPSEARSSHYCTDVAKMLQIPIFHVNGEDPEAVAAVVKMAMEFRRQFGRDAVIDMYGYRKLGHNESDEPAFTQPLIYAAIAKRKSSREAYLDRLLKLGGVTREEADAIADRRRQELEKELNEAHSDKPTPAKVRQNARRLRRGPRRRRAGSRNRRAAQTVAIAIGKHGARARRFPSAPQNRAHPQGPRTNGARRTAARLGGGRGFGLCDAFLGRGARSPDRAGLGTGHVLAPPRRLARCRERRGIHAAPESGAAPRPLGNPQLAALGDRRLGF